MSADGRKVGRRGVVGAKALCGPERAPKIEAARQECGKPTAYRQTVGGKEWFAGFDEWLILSGFGL